jgi:MFS family permease
VLRSPSLRALIAAVTAANFVFGGYAVIVLVFLARQLGVTAGVIGLLTAIGSVGGIAGSLAAGPVARRIGDARVTWVVTGGAVLCFALIPLTGRGGGLAWFAGGSFGLTAGITMFNVCVRAALQRSAPPALLGRITASMRVFSRGALPIGALVAGALADWLTPRTALVILAVCYAVVPVWLRISPLGRSRELADLAAGTPAPAPGVPEPERA